MSLINGYPYVYMPSHPNTIGNSGCVYEHVLVAEKTLNRYLRPGETVHHIDANRSNNSPENLMVFAESKYHTMYHMSHGRGELVELSDGTFIYKLSKTVNKCVQCGKDTLSKEFCSSKCASFQQRHVEWPTKEELEEMVYKKVPFLTIGKRFGVSDNAVRKWCKNYGIPFRKKDINAIVIQM